MDFSTLQTSDVSRLTEEELEGALLVLQEKGARAIQASGARVATTGARQVRRDREKDSG